MIYYLNIFLPLVLILLIYVLSRVLNSRNLRTLLTVIFSIFALISFPIILTDLRANVWIYDYFLTPIFISSIAVGILIISSKKYFKLTSILVGLIAFGLNFFWNFTLSFASAWSGGDYNEPHKNEPILKYENLEVVEHEQNSEFSHYMLNRTYINGLVYRQVGFETRNNPICRITFELRDTKEKYEFDKCNSTMKIAE